MYDKYLSIIKLKEDTKIINRCEFTGYNNVAIIEMPDTVTEISEYGLYRCYNLLYVKLSNNINYIGNGAFQECFNLLNVEIPASVKYLGSNAFSSCKHLKTVTFKGKPDYIGDDAFSFCYRLKVINVPWSKGEVSGSPWGAGDIIINYNCNNSKFNKIKIKLTNWINKIK